MSWWHIIKFHPDLRRLAGDEKIKVIQLGDEESMKELWDASNPDMPHTLRSENKWKYPIDNWFGMIVTEGGKNRLVTVVGNAIETGKEGRPYAYFGGAKTHPDYRGKGLMREVREKALTPIKGMPRIAGFTGMRKKLGLDLNKPKTHKTIPDNVLAYMNERIEHLDNVDDWGITE